MDNLDDRDPTVAAFFLNNESIVGDRRELDMGEEIEEGRIEVSCPMETSCHAVSDQRVPLVVTGAAPGVVRLWGDVMRLARLGKVVIVVSECCG